MERLTLGKMQNPVRGMLHGAAAVVSVAGLVVLVVRSIGDGPRLWSMVVFGASLVALYTTSSLYHSVPWRPVWKARFQQLDHSMILVLIAGSYTPFAVNVLDGGWRIGTLIGVWTAAVVGIVQKFAWPQVRVWFTITLATLMGWAALAILPEMARSLSTGALVLVLAGGVAYTIGMIAFATRRPRLFPRVFSYHEVFHVLVVTGSVLHFLVVFWHVSVL